MSGVHDHPAVVVDQEVEPSRRPGQDEFRCLFRVQRNSHRPGEVVAGSHGDQAESGVLKVVEVIERLHREVQAAVAAEHDDITSGASAKQFEKVVWAFRPRDLDLGPRFERGLDDLDGLVNRASRLRVGDHQQFAHACATVLSGPSPTGPVQ